MYRGRHLDTLGSVRAYIAAAGQVPRLEPQSGARDAYNRISV